MLREPLLRAMIRSIGLAITAQRMVCDIWPPEAGSLYARHLGRTAQHLFSGRIHGGDARV